MKIKRIHVKNFRSFDEIDVEVGNLNVLIGANASGKSNFIQIFQFLKDVLNKGLENAVSLQGGESLIRNVIGKESKDLFLRIFWDGEPPERQHKYADGVKKDRTETDLIYFSDFDYEFVLRFKETETIIIREVYQFKWHYLKYSELTENSKFDAENLKKTIRSGYVAYKTNGKNREVETEIRSTEDIDFNINPYLPEIGELPSNSLLMEMPEFKTYSEFDKLFNSIGIYDFNTKLLNLAVGLSNEVDLKADGSNLAFVIKRMKKNEDKTNMLLDLIRDALPFIENIEASKLFGENMFLNIQESYCSEKLLPAFSVSDGTKNIIALIAALYFENKKILMFEEVDKYLHPRLMSKIADYLKDVSEIKQIFATTHNPELVQYSNLEDLILFKRNKKGHSEIIKPSKKKQINDFLDNELLVQDLYVDGILEVLN